eukprot:6458761-Amphidinium_carterae.1
MSPKQSQVIFTENSAAGANAAGNQSGPYSAQPAQTQSNVIPNCATISDSAECQSQLCTASSVPLVCQ